MASVPAEVPAAGLGHLTPVATPHTGAQHSVAALEIAAALFPPRSPKTGSSVSASATETSSSQSASTPQRGEDELPAAGSVLTRWIPSDDRLPVVDPILSTCCTAQLVACVRCGGVRCRACGLGSDDHPAIQSCRCTAPAALPGHEVHATHVQPVDVVVARRHAAAVAALRGRPEGKAMARAEVSLRAELGMYDPLRQVPEEPQVARTMPLRSVADHPVRTAEPMPKLQRWEAKVRAAGVDPSWRPVGGERGLLREGFEDSIDVCRAWLAAEAQDTAERFKGEHRPRRAELYQESEKVLRYEALVMMPWFLGRYSSPGVAVASDAPVPCATMPPHLYRRMDGVSSQ